MTTNTLALLRAAAGITPMHKAAISWPGAGSGFTPPPLMTTPAASTPKPPAPPKTNMLGSLTRGTTGGVMRAVGSQLPAMAGNAALGAFGGPVGRAVGNAYNAYQSLPPWIRNYAGQALSQKAAPLMAGAKRLVSGARELASGGARAPKPPAAGNYYGDQIAYAQQRYDENLARSQGNKDIPAPSPDYVRYLQRREREMGRTINRMNTDPGFLDKMRPEDIARLYAAQGRVAQGKQNVLSQGSSNYIAPAVRDAQADRARMTASQELQPALQGPTKDINLNTQKPLLAGTQPGQSSPAGQLLGAASSLVPPQPRAVAPPTQPKPATPPKPAAPPKPVAPAQPQWPTQQVNQPSPGARPASISTPIGGTARFAPEPIPPSPIRDMTRFEAPQAKPFNPTTLMPQLKTPSGIEPDNRGDLLAQSDAAGEEAYATLPSPQAPIRPDEMAGYMPAPQPPTGADGLLQAASRLTPAVPEERQYDATTDYFPGYWTRDTELNDPDDIAAFWKDPEANPDWDTRFLAEARPGITGDPREITAARQPALNAPALEPPKPQRARDILRAAGDLVPDYPGY